MLAALTGWQPAISTSKLTQTRIPARRFRSSHAPLSTQNKPENAPKKNKLNRFKAFLPAFVFCDSLMLKSFSPEWRFSGTVEDKRCCFWWQHNLILKLKTLGMQVAAQAVFFIMPGGQFKSLRSLNCPSCLGHLHSKRAKHGGEQPLYWWPCQKVNFTAVCWLNGPRVTNVA